MLEPRLLRASMMLDEGTPGGVAAAVPGLPKPPPPTFVGRPEGVYDPPAQPEDPELTAPIIGTRVPGASASALESAPSAVGS